MNPFGRIRDLERQLESVELARVKAEDECRLLHAQLTIARESESQARKDLVAVVLNSKSEKITPPPPARRPTLHGAELENEMIAKFERELSIE